MPLAYLPSPASGQWRLGPIPVHLYALCLVAGVVIAIAVGERRYTGMGGRRWLIWDIATIAVPAALLGGWLFRLVAGTQAGALPYGGWLGAVRIWDGGVGLPGAAAGGLAATWLWCRRDDLAIGPVLTAVLPGLALGLAAAVTGTWFTQSMYGPPSAMAWAVQISPYHRAAGFESVSYFQPIFLYQALVDVAVAGLLVYLIDRLALTGVRALVLGVGLYALGWLVAISFVLSGPAIGAGQVTAVGAVIAAGVYLVATRSDRGPESLRAARWFSRPLPEGGQNRDDASPDGAPGGIRTHT